MPRRILSRLAASISLTAGVAAPMGFSGFSGFAGVAGVACLTTQASAQVRHDRPPRRVHESDLSRAIQRLEKSLAGQTLTAQQVTKTNLDVDEATDQFMGGETADAVAAIDRLTVRAELNGRPPLPTHRVVSSLIARFRPQTHVLGALRPPALRVESVYPTRESSARLEFKLRVVAADGSTLLEHPFIAEISNNGLIDHESDLDLKDIELPFGAYDLHIVCPDGLALHCGRWSVVTSSPAAKRRAILSRLDGLNVNPELEEAVKVCRARSRLLTDGRFSPDQRMAIDVHQLMDTLTAEVDAIAAGDNPYQNRIGNYWRVFILAGMNVGARVHAPPAAAEAAPLPVIIALHGDGGSEHSFMDAYGGGVFAQLAEEHGFLAVTPVTYVFDNPKRLDELLDALQRVYSIDAERVYLMGYSFGAVTAAHMAGERPEMITATSWIAGAPRSLPADARIPPTLVIAGEYDATVSAADLESLTRDAAAAGHPIEFRRLSSLGHTLIAGAAAPEVVKWLLEQRPER